MVCGWNKIAPKAWSITWQNEGSHGSSSQVSLVANGAIGAP